MTEDQLAEMLRRAGRQESASPTFEGVDEAAVLLDRVAARERLSAAEKDRLAELAATNRVVRDELAATLATARSASPRIQRLRPVLAAAAVLAAAIGVGLYFRGAGTGRPDTYAVGGWAATDFVSLSSLSSKEPPVPRDGSRYEREIGRLRDQLTSITSPEVLQRATWAALATGHDQDATRFAHRWVQVQPYAAEVLNAVGLAALLGRRFEEAEGCFRQAGALSPQNPDFLANQIVAASLLARPTDDLAALVSRLRVLAPQHRSLPELERSLPEAPSGPPRHAP